MTGQPSPLVVLMGVSGTGKTTVARLLAAQCGWDFQEGDDLHPESNREKMAAGQALTDDDRWPWLERVAQWLDAQRSAGRPGVVTCSALRRRYRDVLAGPWVVFVLLTAPKQVLADRLARRSGHYMPASLLQSQLDTLEPPTPDENALTVDATGSPQECVALIRRLLGHSG